MTPLQKAIVGVPASFAVGALFVTVYSLGQRSVPAPQLQRPMVQMAAAPPAPAVRMPIPMRPPIRTRPAEPMNDGTLAAWISTCHGEELYGELWRIDEQANRDITYAMLERNAERYHGTPVVFTGEVLEIQDVPESNAAYFRMALNDSYSRPVAVFALSPPPDEVVRGRRVRVYGTIGGAYSYQSQAGWDITIPKLNAVAVVLASMPRRPPRAVRPPAPEVPQIRMDPIAPRAAAVRDPEPVAEEPTVAETPAETPRPCSGHMCYRMDGTPTCVPARISCAAMHYTETPPGAPNTM